MFLMASRMVLAGAVIAAGFWMKGAGLAGVMNLVAVSEAPCGTTGVDLAECSDEREMLGQGGLGNRCNWWSQSKGKQLHMSACNGSGWQGTGQRCS